MARYTHADLTRHADEVISELVMLAVDFATILPEAAVTARMTEEELAGQNALITQILEAMSELGHTTMAIEAIEARP